jgi:hypothetical protein
LSEASFSQSASQSHNSKSSAQDHPNGLQQPVVFEISKSTQSRHKTVKFENAANEYGIQQSLELQKVQEISAVMSAMFENLQKSSIKEIGRAMVKDKGTPSVRSLIRFSNARINELTTDATDRFGKLLRERPVTDPLNLMMRMFTDDASARMSVNDLTEGILEQTIQRLDKDDDNRDQSLN